MLERQKKLNFLSESGQFLLLNDFILILYVLFQYNNIDCRKCNFATEQNLNLNNSMLN